MCRTVGQRYRVVTGFHDDDARLTLLGELFGDDGRGDSRPDDADVALDDLGASLVADERHRPFLPSATGCCR
jgi:hypothetical protein